MHRATAVGWTLPTTGSQVGDELIRRDAELHAKRLASIKPTINTHAPVAVYTHLTDRRKKAVTEFQRAAVIEHENLLLMSRFRNIIARKQVDNIPSVAVIPRSLNRHYRTTQLTNIVLENEKIINRLIAAKGVLTTKKQFEKQAEENEKIVRRHCEYPFQDPLKFRNEYYSDPANPYRNFSGGKERIVRPGGEESEEEKQNFYHRSINHSRNNSRPQSSYSTHRGATGAWTSRPSSSYSRQPNSSPNASPATAAVNSTSSAQPAAHTPQSPTSAPTHHHHRRPQSAHLHPEQLVAQDPVLLSARRRDVIPRFLPLKLQKDPQSFAKKNQEMEKEVAEIEKEEEERRKKNAPPRATGRRSSHSRRPSTAQHHHRRQQQRSPSPHAGAHHTLPSFEEIRQEDLTNILVRDETESPVPAGSTSSSPIPPSTSAASPSPALPAFPTAPPPLLLFEGAVLISGKLSQVRICEATHPWRIEIQVFDPRTNMEYEIQLPFQQLKPFFLTNPDFFSPADRRKTALVDLLKDGLCFRHVLAVASADGSSDASTNSSNAGEIELCLDLVQPIPPPPKVIPPSADSVQKKHEELKRERAAALLAAEKDAFKPKTQTIVSPRVKAIASGEVPDSPRSKANYVTRVNSPRSKHSEGLTVPTISQLALGPGMSSRSRSASPRKAPQGFGSFSHMEVDEASEDLNEMFVISKQLPIVPFSPTGATGDGGSDSPSFASMIPLPASPLSIASNSPPIPPVSIAATPAPPEAERLYHIPTHRNKFSLQFQPRTDFIHEVAAPSPPVAVTTEPVQFDTQASLDATSTPDPVETSPAVVAEEKAVVVDPTPIAESNSSPEVTVSPPLETIAVADAAPAPVASPEAKEITSDPVEAAVELAPPTTTQVTAPAVVSMLNKSPSQLMAALLDDGVVDSELVDDLDAIDQLDENEAANYSSKPPSIPTSRNHSRPASARPHSAGASKPIGEGDIANLPPLPDSKSISASPRASTLREIEEMDDLTDLAIDDFPASPVKADENITTAATV